MTYLFNFLPSSKLIVFDLRYILNLLLKLKLTKQHIRVVIIIVKVLRMYSDWKVWSIGVIRIKIIKININTLTIHINHLILYKNSPLPPPQHNNNSSPLSKTNYGRYQLRMGRE
jgi:hypothetical protein